MRDDLSDETGGVVDEPRAYDRGGCSITLFELIGFALRQRRRREFRAPHAVIASRVSRTDDA